MLTLRRRTTTPVDKTMLDVDHDLDIVQMADSARTQTELEAVERVIHARLTARRQQIKAGLFPGRTAR